MKRLVFPLQKSEDLGYLGVDKYTPKDGSFTLFFAEDGNGRVLAKAKKSDGSIEDLGTTAEHSYADKRSFTLSETDTVIRVPKSCIPVAVEFLDRLYSVYSQSIPVTSDEDSWVINISHILAVANIPNASGVWVVWFYSSDSCGNSGIGTEGPAGEDGKTYIPSISDGVLSFTVDGVDSGIPHVNVIGPEGPQGKAGKDGVNGKDGKDGEVGPQGPEGPAGPQGPQGPQGEQGPEGPAGKTPERGKDYWTSDDISTIVEELKDIILNNKW